MTVFILLSLIILRVSFCATRRFDIYATSNRTYYFQRHDSSKIHMIPDVETITLLGFNLSSIAIKSDSSIDSLTQGNPLPTLIQRSNDPDEALRVVLDRALMHDPAKYVIKLTYIDSNRFVDHEPSKAFNPSFVWWDQPSSILLFCYRTGDINSLLLSQLVHYSRMRSNLHFINESTIFVERGRPPVVWLPNRRAFSSQEDCRMLKLPNGKILNLFSGSFAKFDLNYRGDAHDKDAIQYYSIGTYNSTIDTFEFGPSIALDYAHGKGHQKNWVPFLYKDAEMHYIQEINPLRVLRVKSVSEDNAATMEVVTSTEAISLPWRGDIYGPLIRGGTPAILVHEMYIALFHTRIFVSARDVYFMGAIAFCPHPPFNIHKMSSHPIVQKRLYDGPWASKFYSYVVFPSGIVLDADGKHLLVSIGHQDNHAYMAEINIHGLIESMDFVSSCFR